jgi:hypothetical protein
LGVRDLAAYHPELAAIGLVAGLGAGVLCRLHRRAPSLVTALAPSAFAVAVIAAGQSAAWWRPAAVVLLALASLTLLPWWPDGGADPRPLLVLSAAGIWYAVPDTEAPVVVLGAVVGLVLLSGSVRGRRWLPMVVLLGLTAWWGARGRPPVRIGTAAMGGALVLVPLLQMVRRRRPPASTVTVIAAHVVAVAAGTLIARQLRHDPGVAVAAAAATYLVTAAVLVLGPARSGTGQLPGARSRFPWRRGRR